MNQLNQSLVPDNIHEGEILTAPQISRICQNASAAILGMTTVPEVKAATKQWDLFKRWQKEAASAQAKQLSFVSAELLKQLADLLTEQPLAANGSNQHKTITAKPDTSEPEKENGWSEEIPMEISSDLVTQPDDSIPDSPENEEVHVRVTFPDIGNTDETTAENEPAGHEPVWIQKGSETVNLADIGVSTNQAYMARKISSNWEELLVWFAGEPEDQPISTHRMLQVALKAEAERKGITLNQEARQALHETIRLTRADATDEAIGQAIAIKHLQDFPGTLPAVLAAINHVCGTEDDNDSGLSPQSIRSDIVRLITNTPKEHKPNVMTALVQTLNSVLAGTEEA
jgi:hypothetical protein